MKKHLFFIFAIMAILSSCEKPLDSRTDLITDYKKGELNQEFLVYEDQSSFAFTAKKNWTATVKYNDDAEADWLNLNKLIGEAGEIVLNISLQTNLTEKNRNAVIVIQCEDFSIEIKIVQKATDENGKILEKLSESDLKMTSENIYSIYTIKGRDYFNVLLETKNALQCILAYPDKTTITKEDLPVKLSVIGIDLPVCTTVEKGAFFGCTKLKTVNLPVCTTVGSNAFSFCEDITMVNLPVCITIGAEAFFACSKLTEMDLPVCTTVGHSAFAHCNELTRIDFPVCTTIKYWTFLSCKKLTIVRLPLCTVIEKDSFSTCSNLKAISLPMCTSVGKGAFYYCEKLFIVNLPLCATVENFVFSNCSSLAEIDLPMCTLIGERVFSNCDKLEKISFLNNNKITTTLLSFDALNTANITITLNRDGVEIGNADGKTWKDKEWKEINTIIVTP